MTITDTAPDTTTDPAEPGGVVDTPAPRIDLPQDGKGRHPIGVKLRLNGACGRILHAHDTGDRIVMLVEARVKKAGHDDTNDGLLWEESAKVLDSWELDAGEAHELLTRKRREYHADDQLTIDDELGAPVTTDGSGVVMTDQERAEALAADQAAVTELEAARKGRVAPWDDYDTLTIEGIRNRLEQTDDRQLVLATGDYEESNKNRTGVLDAVSKRSAILLARNGA